ncbi:MAG: PqqD family protein [Clostridiaceae bacterium]
MKVKNGFMLREIAKQWVVIPLGSRVVEFNGIMTLSESGAILWRLLEKDATEDELVAAMLDEYEVDEETARNDVRLFLGMVQDKNLFE